MFLGIVPTVWYLCFYEPFRQCGIYVFRNRSDDVVFMFLGTVPTVWYLCLRNRSDSVVFMFLGIVPTVWYLCF